MKPKISEVIVVTHALPNAPFFSAERHPNVDVEFWRAKGELQTFDNITPAQFRRISQALSKVRTCATTAQADGENIIVYFDVT